MSTAQQLLKQYFGYDEFRGLQQQIVEHVTAGKDCLVLMPTGGGKSICYQIPALSFDGLTIVVSPLISLMKDQVDALRANGIQAAYLNSSLTWQQEQEIAALCFHSKLKILYLSPEKALALLDQFLTKLHISLIAIDEAHCVSQWGHDFRPEYKELSRLRKTFSKVPMMALTATADKITRQDILTLLGLHQPELFIASFDRPNLSLTVRQGLNKKEKLRDIIRLIERHPNESGIIYCTSRKTVDALTLELRQAGIKAKSYHAGLSSEERSEAQEAFINDQIEVVCATIAFGMGIDKSNVRFVVHFNLPKSIEGYYQEIGRGGRDGLPCDTVLYYSLGDVMMLRQFAEASGQQEVNIEKLKRMQDFAEAAHCRRRILLSYFGQQHTENCGNCDICLHPPKTFDGTLLAQKALSALERVRLSGVNAGMYLLIDVLRGMKHKEILERKLDQIKTYGAGADISNKAWYNYLMQMIQLGAMEIAYNEGNTLRLTTFGDLILKGKFELPLHAFVEDKKGFIKPEGKSYTSTEMPGKANDSVNLYEALRKLRKQIADELHLAPYIIFHDATLKEMVETVPHTEEEMLMVNGVSFTKMERYGYRFLEITSMYSRLNQPADDTQYLLSQERLKAYMDELLEKELRFSAAVVGKVLTGSLEKSYAGIASAVSFRGLLAGRLTYAEVSKLIKPFYAPFEQAIKEEQRKLSPTEEELAAQRIKVESYFHAEAFNHLTDDQIETIRNQVNQIPMQKTDESLTDGIKELRKRFPRSHEPWNEREIELIKHMVEQCNNLELIVSVFGRSSNSVLVISSKWIA